jgi:protein-S-isoprenylcysteine O-methyltransferase Ste14
VATPHSIYEVNDVARALQAGIFVLWLLVEIWVFSSRPSQEGQESGENSPALFFGSIVFAMVAGGVLAARGIGPVIGDGGWAIFGVGVLIASAGIALRIWSVETLGQYFQVKLMVTEDQPVITSGPYRLIRHPSYAGALLTFAGLGVCYGNWLSLALMVVLPGANLVYRIVLEERMLVGALGDEYVSYTKRTARLIPYVW